MNTNSIATSSRPLVWRFAWKEYRMLRGLLLASVIIAVVVQMLFAWALAQYRQDLINSLFAIAWTAAALYAVGAAITMFAAETEEHTRDYLRLLPGDWRPIFATKVALALVSAVLLGILLTLTGAWLAGSLPAQQNATYVLGVAGVAMLELLAWGLMFSLWWKHPLVAAIAAMAAASFGAQWAIFATTSENNSWTAEAYLAAVPARLAICLIVFAVDVWLGRRWLHPVPTRSKVTVVKPASGMNVKTGRVTARPRLKMFTRLLWQTWRESWLTILIALPLSLALVVVALIPAYVSNVHDFLRALPFVALVPPALLGALAFRADQKRDHRLFLATHAAWPRYVWLTRHVVWLGVVMLLGIVIHASGSWIMQSLFRGELQNYFDGRWRYHTQWLGREFSTQDRGWTQAWRFEYMQATYERSVITAWAAFLAAYGIGQLCSMVFKQTVLAGFLAILLAVVLAAWSVLMYFWEMNPLWFVLPIGVAALLATWLRVPSWILQQRQLRHWLWPAGAIAVPLIALVTLLPATRMAQLDNLTRGLSQYDEPFAKLDAQHDKTRSAANQTALEYERLGAQINGSNELILKRLRTGILQGNKLRELAERVIEITARPYCRIPSSHLDWGLPTGLYLRKLNLLLKQDSLRLETAGELGLAFDRLVAQLRLLGHKLQNQTSSNFSQILYFQRPGKMSSAIDGVDIFSSILDWAQAEGQTSARIKEAIVTLDTVFSELPRPSDAIYADRERVRRILLEEDPPNNNYHLAGILNRLPGEQERALRALDLLAFQAGTYATAIDQLIDNTSQRGTYGPAKAGQLRNDLRTAPWSSLYAIYPRMFDRDRFGFRAANQLADACATSFLAANAFENGDLRQILFEWTGFVTRARALSVQLALIAYHLDHGTYPETLDALVPDYLPKMIHDPFSGAAFHYRPEGLNLPLAYNDEWESQRLPDIPRGTPLLWSVGLGNCVLKEFFEYDAETEWAPAETHRYGGMIEGTAAMSQRQNLGRQVMGLEPTEQFSNDTRFVFPLPKLLPKLEDAAVEKEEL